jgi:hypothetical protein
MGRRTFWSSAPEPQAKEITVTGKEVMDVKVETGLLGGSTDIPKLDTLLWG